MDNKINIENYSKSLFSKLSSYGFSEALVNKDRWEITKINWLRKEISLELVLDWRENAVDFIFVRLVNGKMPNGYLMSDGKPCRYYLEKLVRNKSIVFQNNINKPLSKIRLSSSLEEKIDLYYDVIMSNIDSIVEFESTVFSEKLRL